MLCRIKSYLIWAFFFQALVLTAPAAYGGVCQDGQSIPPFLSSGADPNLLLVIDNSGSMLDLAYVATVGECVDNGFDTTTEYAGLYDADTWYVWVEGQPQWRSGTTYTDGTIVYSQGIFYRATEASGTASSGVDILSDPEVTWEEIHYIETWVNGSTYAAKTFIRYENQLYYTVAGGTADDTDATDGISIDGDTGIAWIPVDSTWLAGETYAVGDVVSDHGRLYTAATAGTATGTGVEDDTGVTWTRLSEGYFEATSYTQTSVAAVALTTGSGTEYTSDDLFLEIINVGGTPSGVSAFAATGNLLNWVSTSKFDIQKYILTGGKYDAYTGMLISEGRGCSSHGFVKEVAVTSGGTDWVVTFSVRGFNNDDWIDTTDDTTRIAITGISNSGFIGSTQQQACQNAIDEVAKGEDWNQGQSKQYIEDCLAYTGTNNVIAESNAAYNHSIHTCWSIVTKGYDDPTDLGNVSEVYNACENIYDNGVDSATISPYNSGYMCYGVYNQPTQDPDRLGYIGRCWEPAVATGCLEQTCTSADNDLGADPALKCFADNILRYCSGNYNSKKDECNKAWEIVYVDGAGDPCTPTSTTDAQWTDDNNPNTAEGCVQQALWDYCGDLQVPEVIDPSDQIFNTGNTWGMPGALIDSGIVSMFGTEVPIIVMKGYISQPTAPEGLLHEVAEDLRMGAMAFNDNGSLTECGYTDQNQTIVKYCPNTNRDGAEIISRIMAGDTVTGTDAAGEDITHVDDLAEALNAIRATAWTPLAEAVYNALGYYGQNSSMRLHSDDFYTEVEDATWIDPVEYWCQENYIMVITEGASTADIHTGVETMVNSMPTDFAGYTLAADEGECQEVTGESDLFTSTYLDDMVYYGKNAAVSDLFTTPAANPGQMSSDDGTLYDKRNISSYFVVAGVPRDDGTTGECNPATLMQAAADNAGTTLYTGEDPSQLESNLRTALSDILFRASAGSAASVISSSRSGEGGVYQAIFWPKIDRGIGIDPLIWIGDVHAFFIDSQGFLWDDYSGNSAGTTGELWTEDLDGDGILDLGEDLNDNGVLDGDRRIVTYFNDTTNTTQICFRQDVIETGTCSASDYYNTAAAPVELRDFDNYLWSASERLSAISDNDISTNRGVLADGTWDFSGGYPKRYIFTWNDLNNDGVIDQDMDGDGNVDRNTSYLNEVLPFEPTTFYLAGGVWEETYTTNYNRESVLHDFNVSTSEEIRDAIAWLRGYDEFEEAFTTKVGDYYPEDLNQNGIRDTILRCRQLPDCDYSTLNRETWRLGDVIHSTPTLVARPAEGYHFVYNDPEYAEFYKKYLNRRHVIYFGSNDGMLHAINGGFYISGLNKFMPCSQDQRSTDTGECLAGSAYDSATIANAYPELGDELWAYVPYNLQPHLNCLTDDEYEHKYFIDAPPRIFDVRIFPDDAVHPNGWGTILVGYMGFGGAPQTADNSVITTENRKFISSYFILDITDPERPPTLLAELTATTETIATGELHADMGYTTPMPSLVVMRNDSGHSEWYLVFGNGPTTVKGQNDQQGKVAIYPLNRLTGVNWTTYGTGTFTPTDIRPFRIFNEDPASTATIPHAGRLLIEADSAGGLESFVGDIVTVDYDLSSSGIGGYGVPYKSDAAYFGTTDGTDFTGTPAYWNGDGRLFRLVTKNLNSSGVQQYTYPESWYLAKLIDAQGPITAAPNIGFDPENYWIYFGTGRFYDTDDKTDDTTQYFFGVREPRDTDCNLTWGEINWLSGGVPIPTDPSQSQGSQGLMRSDVIKVLESSNFNLLIGNYEYIYCEEEDGTACTLPLTQTFTTVDSSRTYYSFYELEQYIKGEECIDANDDTIGIDGWYRELTYPRERSLGMPTLLGGLTTFTTYQPYSDVCQAEGASYLYGVYYLTGTAWYESVFGTEDNDEDQPVVKEKLDLGKGQATTPSLHVGSGEDAAKAYIQTSTGEIVEVGQENLPLKNYKSGRTSWKMQ